MKYGSIDLDIGKSITELEYDEARKCGLPSLIYLLDEERQPILPKYVDTGTSAESLRRFKDELKKRHIISRFTTPDDLAKRIVLDLPPLAERVGAEVRQGELAKIIAAIPRIDWLTKERYTFLRREMGALAEEVPRHDVLREVLEFLLSGDRQAAIFLLGRTSHRDIRKAIDYAMAVETVLKQVIERGMKILEKKSAVESEQSDADRKALDGPHSGV